MGITFSNRIVAVVAGAAIAVGVQALAPRAGAGTSRPAARPAGVTVVQDALGTAAQAAAVRYWTPARMVAALRAADGAPAATKPAQHRAVGKHGAVGKHRVIEKHGTVGKHVAAKVRPSPERPLVAARSLVRQAPPAWLTGDTAGDGLRWTRGGAAAAAVGKIFFTLGGEDYVCSGALVGGRHADVVLTAAHCVTGGQGQVTGGQGQASPGHASQGHASQGHPVNPELISSGQWATNWVFVPGFRDGLLPYGEYTARRFFVTSRWTGPGGGSEEYDVAFVQVTAATLYGGPGGADGAEPPAGLPVGFATSQDAVAPGRAYVFGYPAEPPYTGLYPSYCAGPAVASGGSVRMSCGMTAGDSGGPWLAGFSPRSGSGTVVAVSTYKVSTNLRVLYGAVLGPVARALYERAST